MTAPNASGRRHWGGAGGAGGSSDEEEPTLAPQATQAALRDYGAFRQRLAADLAAASAARRALQEEARQYAQLEANIALLQRVRGGGACTGLAGWAMAAAGSH